MNRLAAAAVAIAAAAAVWFAPAAAADPAAPFVPGTAADCAGQAVPLDPRVSVQNPVGTLMFRAMLDAMCRALPPPQTPLLR